MATVQSNGSGGGNWSDGDSWDGGEVPADTDRVVILQGDTIVIDGVCKCTGEQYSTSSDHSKAAIEIHGILTCKKDTDTELHTKGQVYCVANDKNDQCVVDFGTEDEPIKKDASFKWFINEDKVEVYAVVSAYYMKYSNSVYPRLSMVSEVEKTRNTYLLGAFDSNSNKITVNDISGWKVGDKLWLTPRYTDPATAYKNTEFEEVTIKEIDTDTNEITLEEATQYDHGYDNENDYPAAGITNLSSNVQIIGAGDDAYFYRFYSETSNIVIKNIEVQYANNVYNYINSIFAIFYGNRYGKDCIFTGNVVWSDSRNIDKHQEGLLYTFFARPANDRIKIENCCFVTKAVKDGQGNRPRIAFYYGGSHLKVKDLCCYAGNRYADKWFSDYQCPVSFENCKTFGSEIGYHLNNNINTDTTNCWVVGSNKALEGFNGSLIHRDMNIRMCNYLFYMPVYWRQTGTLLRLKYNDNTIAHPQENYIYRENPLPDGIEIKLLDIKDNPKQQMLATSFGSFYRDINTFYSSVASIKCQPVNKDNSLIFSTNKFVLAGKTIKVKAVLRKDSDYNGDTNPLIRLQCSQFNITKEIDDTNDEWIEVSIESDKLQNNEYVNISVEGIGDKGHFWVDDLHIDDKVFDIGTNMFFGGTEISNVIDITETRTTLKFENLENQSVAILDNSSELVDYADNVTGEYVYTAPYNATGPFVWVTKRIGYKHSIGTFDPATGSTIILKPISVRKINVDGSDAYLGTSSDLVDIVFDDTTNAFIDIGNGKPTLQAIYDEVERALATSKGMAWLGNFLNGVSTFSSISGDFLFLTTKWRVRRKDTDSVNATIPAFIQSVDSIFVDGTNGDVKFMTSNTPDVIAQKVKELLNTQLTAIQNNINNIPTNPLLTNDDRLDKLDKKISEVFTSDDRNKLNSLENYNDTNLQTKIDSNLNISKSMDTKIDSNLNISKSMDTKIDYLTNIETGNWEIKDNQMLFKDTEDNILLTYKLYNKLGIPSDRNVYKRELVK